MFRKSLTDLVKGIRANKKNEDGFIRLCIDEIREELRSPDMKLKAIAIQKLTYLHMLGYDMEWAAIHAITLISQPQFNYKRIGYLAMAQCFHETTDVIIMTTQAFKKDLTSSNQYEVGLAISCLANICTPDLARDLVSDVEALLNSSRKYVRKKAVLVLFKIFLQYPDALRPLFPRLKEKLQDSHPSVVASAVNVICELARKNPKNYLSLAAIFYRLLTSLNNNWTLIKIVKLFGALTPHEPRLAKKLIEPMTNIINTTPAKSLLYECLYTVTKGMSAHISIVKLAVDKLKEFVQDPDQNLKYLGLLGLNNIMPKYPRIISDMKDLILQCLEDKDVTIKYRALDLICGVVNQKNIKAIIHKISKHCITAEGAYKNYLVEKIITTCAKDNYKNIANFKWYLKILIKLTEMKDIEHGKLIAFQLMNTNIRVKSIRPFGVSEMLNILKSGRIQNDNAENSSMLEVLNAAAWIVGEFITVAEEEPEKVLEALFAPRMNGLPPRIQAGFVQAIMKVYAYAANKKDLRSSQDKSHAERLQEMRDMIRKNFDVFRMSSDVEVQERASCCLRLLQLHEELLDSGLDIGSELRALVEEELLPVAPDAASKVPIPEGLNLDEWIYEPFEPSKDSDDELLPGEGLSDEPSRTGGRPSYSGDVSAFILGKKVPVKDAKELVSGAPKLKVRDKKKRRKPKPKSTPKIEGPVEVIQTELVPEGAVQKPVETEDLSTAEARRRRLAEITLSNISGEEKLPEVKPYDKQTREDFMKQEEKKESRSVEKKPEKKHRHRKHREKSGEEKEKKHRRHRKHREKKTEQEAPKQQTGNLLSLDAILGGDTATQPEQKERKRSKSTHRKKKRLAKDENLKISYDPKTKPIDANHLDIAVELENTSNFTIKTIDYDLVNILNTQLIRSGNQSSGPIRANFSLKAGEKNNVILKLVFKSIERPQKLNGQIDYTIEKGAFGETEKKTIPFKLSLPCSTFFVPKKISSDALANLLKGNELSSIESVKCKFTADLKNAEEAANAIASQLGCSIVGKAGQPPVYHMYAQSVQGHHLSVILKGAEAGVVCEMRCSGGSNLTSNLASEVKKLFKTKH